MLGSAVSRNQAADPPQLLQEGPAPAPLHHRFYGPGEPMVRDPKPLQSVLASNKKLQL